MLTEPASTVAPGFTSAAVAAFHQRWIPLITTAGCRIPSPRSATPSKVTRLLLPPVMITDWGSSAPATYTK